MLLPLLLAFLAPFAAPDRSSDKPGKPPAPAPERVQAAVAELDAAFAKPDAGPRIRAIEGAAGVADAKVARGVGRGLADPDVAVQKAAIEALRFLPHERALDELVARARVKAAQDDPSLHAALLRAIGQHGDPRSIELLADNALSASDAQVIQARILGLGRIRTKAALEELTNLMEKVGPLRIQPFMKDFRLALWSISGVDQGESRELWLRWYRENKAKLAIPPEPRAEPRELARRWESYWAAPSAEGAARKERPRGGDRREGEK